MLSHERPTLARRGFLSGLAAVPVAAAVVTPTFPAVAAPMSDMETLWISYLQARHAHQAAERAYTAAYAQLPWWVQSGPSLLKWDGSMGGPHSSYPAIQDATRPESESISRLIRPTPSTIERDFHAYRGLIPDADRIARRDRSLSRLCEREAAAQVERESVNEPALSKAEDDAQEAAFTIEDAILELAPVTPAVIAMRIMVQTRIDANSDTSIDCGCELGIAALGLRGLMPMLKGEIAATAADLISDPGRRLDASRLWLGIAPAVSI